MAVIDETSELLTTRTRSLVVPVCSSGALEGRLATALLAGDPATLGAYRAAASGGRLAIGSLALVRASDGRLLILFPTRTAPGERVTIDAIEQGLIAQRLERVAISIGSLAPVGPVREAARKRLIALLGELSLAIELHP
jgi:hypothetical protein